MSNEQLALAVPSLFAVSPSPRVSPKYKFISTQEYLRALADLGWQVEHARQSRSKVHAPEHVKHTVILSHRTLGFSNEQLGSIRPRIILINSHNHSSRFDLLFGIFRLACTNGLMVGSGIFDNLSFPHTKSAKDVAEVVDGEFFSNIDRVLAIANTWNGIDLTNDEMVEFAKFARELRFGPDSKVDPTALLSYRNAFDANKIDLWTIFNVIQQNCVQGGFKLNGLKRATRQIKNISKELTLNLSLWQYAEDLAKRILGD